MDITRRSFSLGLAAFGFGSTMLGAISFAKAEAPVRGGALRMWVNEPTTLVSAYTSAGQTAQISGKIFDGLVEYDFDMKPVPKLATSFDLSPDGKTLTFKLRDDVKWHDGQKFTSADVKYSALDVWKKLHPRGRSTYANLEDVETPDEYTAIFHFSKPAPYVTNALFSTEAQVIPRHIYEGTDVLNNPANLAPVGTGPYRFGEWQQGEYIVLERNEDYWIAERPYLDQIILRIIPDAAARAVAFQAGELDIGGGGPVSMADARRLSEVPELTIPDTGFEAYGNATFMEVNLRKPYLQDVRVRKALLHAVDREFIRQNVYYGFGNVATGPVPAGSSFFYSDDVTKYAYDPETAKALLEEAGLKPDANGVRLTLTLDCLPFGDQYFRMADVVKQNLALVGIQINIRSGDFATYYRRVYHDYDFDLTCSGASAFTDPTIGLQRFFWSKNIVPGVNFSNGSGYNNNAMDDILEAAQSEMDVKARTDLFHRFQKLAVDDLPLLPICDVPYLTLKRKAVKNTELTPFGIGDSFVEAYIEN